MAFLKRFFRRPDLKKAKEALIAPMERMASEADRAHRDQVSMASDEFRFGGVSGLGLYKARLQAAVMPVYVYLQQTKDQEGGLDLLEAASGIALAPLVEEEADVRFSQEEASSEPTKFLMRAFRALGRCMDYGPLAPGEKTPGFNEVIDLVHEALADSVGPERYYSSQEHFGPPGKSLEEPVEQVSPRDRFHHLVRGYAFGAVNQVWRMLDGSYGDSAQTVPEEPAEVGFSM